VQDAAPLVSVIIPAYNRERLLPDALASVAAQGCDSLEVIVVDDGSTDGTARVAESHDAPVRCVIQEHRGVSIARNRGLRESRGELIAFLDSDDLWPASSLAHRLDLLRANPGADIVYGKTRVHNLVPQTTLRRYRDGEAIHHPSFGSMLVRRTVFDRIGLVNETFDHSEDIEWLCRAKEAGVPMLLTDEVVLEYRIHGGNMTSESVTNRQFLFRALKQSLDRRRSGDEQ
jgi:glycosyltransferase involved in cell wall biosynthesis